MVHKVLFYYVEGITTCIVRQRSQQPACLASAGSAPKVQLEGGTSALEECNTAKSVCHGLP